jgi:hypothetical protein
LRSFACAGRKSSARRQSHTGSVLAGPASIVCSVRKLLIKANGVSMPIRPEMRGLYPSSRLASVPPHVIVMTRRATLPHSGRVIATPRVAGFKSESVAGFIPESVAGLLRNQH